MTRVLVVDDSALARQRAREPLEAAGFEIREAEDGAQALHRFDEVDPDAIVLNVEMPTAGGHTVMDQLDKRQEDVPVVISTARDDEETARRFLERGARDYLPKDPLFELHVTNAVQLSVDLTDAPPAGIDEGDPARVLVLDDSPLIRRMISGVLDEAELPMDVVEAETAEEAQRRVEEEAEAFDVLLVDHQLPGVQGADFLEGLRDEGVSVPAIGLSGTRDPDLAERFLDAGAYGLWTKEHETPLRLRVSVERLARWNRTRSTG